MNNNLYNKDFRQKLLANPKKAMSEFNSEIMNDVKVVVKKNTSDIIYFVMPDRGTLGWSGDYIDGINAAGDKGKGCFGTLSTAPTCFSSASSKGF